MPAMIVEPQSHHLPKGIALGEFLFRVRQNRRWSQSEIVFRASPLGKKIDGSSISRLEKGDRKNVHGDLPAIFARVFYDTPRGQRAFLDVFETLTHHRPADLLDETALALIWSEWEGRVFGGRSQG